MAHAVPGLLQTSQENAQILSGWTGGEEVVSELFAYLSTLGVEGAGLVEATASAPIVGHIVGGSCAAIVAVPSTALLCILGGGGLTLWSSGMIPGHNLPLVGANAMLVRLAEVPPCLQASLLVRWARCLQLLCCRHSTRCWHA